jgi:hypothetical protein
MMFEGKCDCCEADQVMVGVASSTLGTFSIPRCRDCLAAGVEPYWACVATVACLGADAWPEGIADSARETIERSIAYAGKTRQEFLADLARG